MPGLTVSNRGSSIHGSSTSINRINVGSTRGSIRASTRGSTRGSVNGMAVAGKGTVSSTRSSTRLYQRGKPINITRTTTTTTTTASNIIELGVECVSNKVQEQIARMFTDVAKDEINCCFPVRCLGSLPLQSKVTSLMELQEPLRKLYLSGAGIGVSVNNLTNMIEIP